MPDPTRQRGAASVESAVILALFLIPLMMGLADVSRLIYTRIAVQEAAQEAAMFYAFEETASDAQIKNRAIQSINSPTLDPTLIVPTCAAVARANSPASEVTVSVTHNVDLIFPLLGSGPIAVTRQASAERFFEC
jgi:Flp pilus assembly protein TadG